MRVEERNGEHTSGSPVLKNCSAMDGINNAHFLQYACVQQAQHVSVCHLKLNKFLL